MERKLLITSWNWVFSLLLILLFLVNQSVSCLKLVPPIAINTWNFTGANSRAWQELVAGHSAVDAIEFGCGQCELDRCDGTVGWGGSPSETGETTLDAMIMDGQNYNIGAVGALRRIRNAIGVARQVLDRTNHSLLVGEMATQFAKEMGFIEETLTSDESAKMHHDWLAHSCQPNYRAQVVPDPRKHCGPYKPQPATHGARLHRKSLAVAAKEDNSFATIGTSTNTINHDTIGMVAIDDQGRVAAGTSTNGLTNKILGRVGDSPVPGAGSYAAREAGAASATGDGDIMMRFLLSYQAVENLRQGMSAQESAEDVISRLMVRMKAPYPEAAVIVLAMDGSYGSACTGFETFPHVISDSRKQIQTFVTKCHS